MNTNKIEALLIILILCVVTGFMWNAWGFGTLSSKVVFTINIVILGVLALRIYLDKD